MPVLKEQYFEVCVNKCWVRGIIHEPKDIDIAEYIIIYCYGLVGDRIDCHRLAVEAGRFFASRKVVFVRFDCGGTGTSDGSSIDYGYFDLLNDILQVASFINKKYQNKKMIFLGISEGAIAASYLAQKAPNCEKRLILWSPVYQYSSNNSAFRLQSHKDNSDCDNKIKNIIKLNHNKKESKKRGVSDLGLWISLTYLIERKKVSDLIDLRYLNDVICLYGTNDERVKDTIRIISKYNSVKLTPIKYSDHLFSHTKYKRKVFIDTLNWLLGD